jgi:hypothetical protein
MWGISSKKVLHMKYQRKNNSRGSAANDTETIEKHCKKATREKQNKSCRREKRKKIVKRQKSADAL